MRSEEAGDDGGEQISVETNKQKKKYNSMTLRVAVHHGNGRSAGSVPPGETCSFMMADSSDSRSR